MTTPAAPIDQLVVVELARLLSRIRVENGFRTDAGQYVITEENHGDIPEDAMSLSIEDDDEETNYQSCKRRNGNLAITVGLNLPMQEVTEPIRAKARRVLADVRQALAVPGEYQFPPGVTGLEIGGRTMFVRDAGSRYFRPELRVRVAFREVHRS